ncbi:DUF2071 domain-containing protein [Streptosporangium sp. G11]|uniref:DUF2071 domain-containing protein n=1 Tax=Streptosporangium sp. G11 TaxID=3436926 RepID=UPI003EBF910E
MAFNGTPRPPVRRYHAQTELDDFAIVSYRVPTGALARLLPGGFAPVEFTFGDGGTGGLVSAVAFRDRDFHFRFLPPAAINCGQINYRAYVTAAGRPGVWFFCTSLDHPLVAVPKWMWGMPWDRTRIDIAASWDATPARWRLTADNAACEAVETGAPPSRLDGFDGPDGPGDPGRGEGLDGLGGSGGLGGSDGFGGSGGLAGERSWMPVLTHPTVGWYRRRDGHVGTYSIWHPPMRPRHLTAVSARFRVFEQLGLTTPDSVPHSILAQRRLHFDIHTPPLRLRNGAGTANKTRPRPD